VRTAVQLLGTALVLTISFGNMPVFVRAFGGLLASAGLLCALFGRCDEKEPRP
jgi:ABC-type xylose transport system permease subunit